ncbi:hypothetical protein [Pseudophaeobacter sp.]|uniref:hypothetical protein n=1 Tax=Pseudophaeobacter sp. TaxID=1971739 RepID=UPI0032975180
MARFLRIYLALSLALVVALTGHASASARGGVDAAGQMVICSGSAAVVIYVDSEGQPTQAPHFCPDCVMHLLDALPLPDAASFLAYAGQAFEQTQILPWQDNRVLLHALARAPPALI